MLNHFTKFQGGFSILLHFFLRVYGCMSLHTKNDLINEKVYIHTPIKSCINYCVYNLYLQLLKKKNSII